MTSGNPIQITHQISIPLNEENYRQNFPHWGSQVLGVLGSLGLQHYLDVTVGHGERWKQDQDQIIRNWLSSSLPPPIVFELSNKPCATAYQLWICLCMMHTMNYFPTVRQLKLSLQMIEKGHATCTQYLQQFNFIVNGLLYMGAAITEQELMHYILKGLGQQFPIIVTDCMLLLLTGSPVNMASFQERLVQEERRLVPLEEERHRLFVARQGQYARPSYSQPATYYSQPVRRTNAGPSQYAPPSLSLSLSLSLSQSILTLNQAQVRAPPLTVTSLSQPPITLNMSDYQMLAQVNMHHCLSLSHPILTLNRAQVNTHDLLTLSQPPITLNLSDAQMLAQVNMHHHLSLSLSLSQSILTLNHAQVRAPPLTVTSLSQPPITLNLSDYQMLAQVNMHHCLSLGQPILTLNRAQVNTHDPLTLSQPPITLNLSESQMLAQINTHHHLSLTLSLSQSILTLNQAQVSPPPLTITSIRQPPLTLN